MHHAPVGIRCPEHANVGAPKPSAARTMRQARGVFTRSHAPVTVGLIGANAVVFLAMLATGGTLDDTSSSTLFAKGALIGQQVGTGEWWRLATAMFLHASIVHIGLNMFVLWVVGSAVEQLIGARRYLLVYLSAGLAGSAGALLLPIMHVNGQIVMQYYSQLPTVGASGAIFGIFGALLVLEYVATGSFTGQAMTLILINLGLSFALSNVSIGGHIGGLIGGVLGMAALAATRYRRERWLGPAIVVGIGAISVVLAIARARGTI